MEKGQALTFKERRIKLPHCYLLSSERSSEISFANIFLPQSFQKPLCFYPLALSNLLARSEKESTQCQEWEGRKLPTKSLFEQEAPKIGTHKCSTKRSVQEPSHVDFAMNSRELVNTEVFEKAFRQTTPLK